MANIQVTISTTPKVVPFSEPETQYVFVLRNNTTDAVVDTISTDVLVATFVNVPKGVYVVSCTKNNESIYSPLITIEDATKTIQIPFELFTSIT